VNAAAVGHYQAFLEFRKEFVPMRVPLTIDGTNKIQLEAGAVVEGVALDGQGKPVPGVEVYARPLAGIGGGKLLPHYEAEGRTGEDGRFRFSNLPSVPVRLNARELLDEQEVTVTPGDASKVRLEGTIAPWHAERLRKKSFAP
jgi:hypothetical protein